MIRIYFVLALIVLAFFLLRKFLKTSPEVISRMIKKTGVFLLLLAIVALAVTGRLNWIIALLGIFVAFVMRMLPYILRYVPQLHRLWVAFNKNKQQSSNSGTTNKKSGHMSIEEAYEILGLDASASEQDIIQAHRKLMQKLHPDRGGSDYLAAKINLAKKVLLQK